MPTSRPLLASSFFALVMIVAATARGDDPPTVPVDLSGYRAECGVAVAREGDRLLVSWPMTEKETGRLVLRLHAGSPLIETLGISDGTDGEPGTILADADPSVVLTVGSRETPKNRPPDMDPFNVFFDNPAARPHSRFGGKLAITAARVESRGNRVTIAVGGLEAGPFRGEWRFTIYAGGRLIKVEAALTTSEERCAILYDLGLNWTPTKAVRLAWTGALGEPRDETIPPTGPDRAIPVRHRAAALGTPSGSLVVSPSPHQFFFPRDFTDNVRTIWAGAGHDGLDGRFGLGIRQDSTGGGNYVPWFNAPPGTEQRLGMFLMIGRAHPPAALAEMREYTRGDQFAPLPGRVTFTSHYHMAITEAAIRAQARPFDAGPEPAFVSMFKEMNVQAVHLGEFHGDGHQYDPGPLRLPELKAMFAECRRLSVGNLLLVPGEEVARYLGKPGPGRESGHWMSLFPRPVNWILDRKAGAPFVEHDPTYGTVYRVGDAKDVQEVLRREDGLAWTAHPRIKSSSWAPDAFLDEPYYRAETWLGAAWKAMPADLSRERLGERGLNLLDVMSNQGGTHKKYMPGEVDVFKLEPSHELYGHMNINYLKLDRLPDFDAGWSPILDALRTGSFFTTTGEILIRSFTVGGAESGGTLAPADGERPELRAELEWTYPLRFAEIVSGDGQRVFRERIELDDTPSFGRKILTLNPDLQGRTWVRLEAWDEAANGAFTQPVWIEPQGP